MTVINSKYNIGDKVWVVGLYIESVGPASLYAKRYTTICSGEVVKVFKGETDTNQECIVYGVEYCPVTSKIKTYGQFSETCVFSSKEEAINASLCYRR